MLGPNSGIKFTTVLIPVTMYDTRPLGKKNLVQLGDAVRNRVRNVDKSGIENKYVYVECEYIT